MYVCIINVVFWSVIKYFSDFKCKNVNNNKKNNTNNALCAHSSVHIKMLGGKLYLFYLTYIAYCHNWGSWVGGSQRPSRQLWG